MYRYHRETLVFLLASDIAFAPTSPPRSMPATATLLDRFDLPPRHGLALFTPAMPCRAQARENFGCPKWPALVGSLRLRSISMATA